MYQFYLDDVLLPVTPSSVSIKVSNQNETLTLINEGEMNVLKQPGLSKISFEALLPNRRYPFAQYPDGFQNAQYYMSLLEKLKTGCKPFAFTIVRLDETGTSLMQAEPMTVSLETYQLDEDADEYGLDVLAKIELLQYREYKTKVVEFQKNEDGSSTATVTESRDTPAKSPSSYTVKSGDNLWNIAKIYLGNGARQKEIYNLNKEVIEAAAKKHGRSSSSNGWWIYPGTVLQLPA